MSNDNIGIVRGMKIDAKQIILDCIKENKSGKISVGSLKNKCIKKNPLMAYEFSFELVHLLATQQLGMTLNRKIYIKDNKK